MKVKTDLHAGGFFEDAGARVDATIDSAGNFLEMADHQAKSLISSITNTTSQVWNSIRTTFTF